ncbi:MAG: signal peptidase I [Bacilli bacterium]
MEITKKKMINKIISLLVAVLLLAVFMALDVMKVAIVNPKYVIAVIILSVLFSSFSLFSKYFLLTSKINYYLYQVLDFFMMMSFALFILQIFFMVGYFPATVHKSSMFPTLVEGDELIVRSTDDAQRFDIVVLKVDGNINDLTFSSGVLDDELLVKRVIAVGGEYFAFVDGNLYINQVLIDEPFLDLSYPEFDLFLEDVCKIKGVNQCTSQSDCLIPEDYFFVLGDNRSSSIDSRALGLFHQSQIIGVVKYKKEGWLDWGKL